ncbi:hypothetical protein [Stenotrophomonas maltophilia]|uniref:hypothetical protein n=1 Tax=Stenotrophomonas maltophilia TaxID=40324 RepID=UPI000A618578|nr:hypothetical protein [Stenotrophomonas maltophilia]MBH1560178.1 hypothetical protein [Stenotrophomonas maltophilia]MCD5965056.1 hypothetical protein [Stenotrophomonas maltophilia]MDZ5786080.1 hypothetical protein [Stenotrophomonas maltophilia]HDS1624149.1 hypothetical protein [Stenotrophomonas maltophilia]HEL3740400.1 hypothetical protein [Stenotrophomonas maltophilia]
MISSRLPVSAPLALALAACAASAPVQHTPFVTWVWSPNQNAHTPDGMDDVISVRTRNQ